MAWSVLLGAGGLSVAGRARGVKRRGRGGPGGPQKQTPCLRGIFSSPAQGARIPGSPGTCRVSRVSWGVWFGASLRSKAGDRVRGDEYDALPFITLVVIHQRLDPETDIEPLTLSAVDAERNLARELA